NLDYISEILERAFYLKYAKYFNLSTLSTLPNFKFLNIGCYDIHGKYNLLFFNLGGGYEIISKDFTIPGWTCKNKGGKFDLECYFYRLLIELVWKVNVDHLKNE